MDNLLRLQEDDDKPEKCSVCGQPVKYISHGEYECVNPQCDNIERDTFGKIRHYLNEHGPASATAISVGTGIPINKITKFLEEGRLEFSGNTRGGTL